MTFSRLIKTTQDVVVGGVACTIRKHSVAFRNYMRLIVIEGRKIETDDDGKLVRVVDFGSIELYRKIVLETIKDGLVSWKLKDSDGSDVAICESVLQELDQHHPEFVEALFGEIELFNLPLSTAKKKP